MTDKVECPECGKKVSEQGLDDHLDAKHNILAIDSWEPDYNGSCQNCGQSPVVTGVRHGNVVMSPDLCGPCCWGEAACIDPENW